MNRSYKLVVGSSSPFVPIKRRIRISSGLSSFTEDLETVFGEAKNWKNHKSVFTHESA